MRGGGGCSTLGGGGGVTAVAVAALATAPLLDEHSLSMARPQPPMPDTLAPIVAPAVAITGRSYLDNVVGFIHNVVPQVR